MRTATERRAHRRVRFSGLAVVRCGAADVPCSGIDLSESGVRLRPSRDVAPPRRQVELLISFSQDGWLPLRARLVRVDATAPGSFPPGGKAPCGVPAWAMRFEPPQSPSTRRALRRLVELLVSVEPPIALRPSAPALSIPEPESVEGGVWADVEAPEGSERHAEPPTARVLPEVMDDLAAKDPTNRLTPDELERLLLQIEDGDPDGKA